MTSRRGLSAVVPCLSCCWISARNQHLTSVALAVAVLPVAVVALSLHFLLAEASVVDNQVEASEYNT